MHQDNYIDDLIAKLAAGTLTDEELAVLVAWYNGLDDTHVVLPVAHHDSVEQLKARMYQRLMAKVKPKPKRSMLIKLLPYAAAVLVAALGVGYFLADRLYRPADTALTAQDIPPGRNRATLTLADGRAIDLSEEQDGIVIGDRITYLDGSKIVDREQLMVGDDVTPERSLPTINYQLSTPKGGTYQITLPDGTHVWLNAASTLTYPSRFSETERVVQLTGEAYFDVSKRSVAGNRSLRTPGGGSPTGKELSAVAPLGESQKNENTEKQSLWPFRVEVGGQRVEVFGTEFNISAYPEDADIRTTLVTGSVRVASSEGSVMLVPGQQSSLGPGGMHVQAVKTGQFIAWKNGKFHFRRTPLEEVLKQVSRWYDVEVVYHHEIPQETFSGKVNRDVSLMGVLNILRLSTIDVKLEGRTLLVN